MRREHARTARRTHDLPMQVAPLSVAALRVTEGEPLGEAQGLVGDAIFLDPVLDAMSARGLAAPAAPADPRPAEVRAAVDPTGALPREVVGAVVELVEEDGFAAHVAD